MPSQGRTWLRPAIIVSLALALFLALHLYLPAKPGGFGGRTNPAFLEAKSLLAGRIALPGRAADSALIRGEVRNVFQPGQTLFFLTHLVLGGEGSLDRLFRLELLLIAVVTMLLIGQTLMPLSGSSPVLAYSLMASLTLGAPYLASLPIALEGKISRVNHCFSALLQTAALRLVARERWHRPRLRPLLTGAAIGGAMLFRGQYLLLLLLPVLLALQEDDGQRWTPATALADRAKRRTLLAELALLGAGPVAALAVILGFQWARFGSPLESGYMLAYVGRDDYIARRARAHGLFSTHFLAENLYRTFWAAPTVVFDGWRVQVKGDGRGNSLLFSQPILMLALATWRSWRTPRVQAFAAAALVLAIPAWLYHNPGVYAPGYMRLALDYLILWAATIAVCQRFETKPNPIPWLAIPAAAWAIGYATVLLR